MGSYIKRNALALEPQPSQVSQQPTLTQVPTNKPDTTASESHIPSQQSPEHDKAYHQSLSKSDAHDIICESPTALLQDPELCKAVQKAHDQYQAARQAHGYELNDTFNLHNKQRSAALEQSLQETKTYRADIVMSPQLTGYLQAQGVDTQQFTLLQGRAIQHCITNELVDVLEHMAGVTLQQPMYTTFQSMTQLCTNVACLTQNLNQQAAIQLSLQGADCCHAMDYFIQGITNVMGFSKETLQGCLQFCNAALEQGLELTSHFIQGAAGAQALELLAAQGMIAAPQLTTAAVAGLFAITAGSLGVQCIMHYQEIGKGLCHAAMAYDAISNLDTYHAAQHMHELSTLINPQACANFVAGCAGGCTVSTPALNNIINHVLSYRPILTFYQAPSGQTAQNFLLMQKESIKRNARGLLHALQQPEYQHFQGAYRNFFGINIFNLTEKELPVLAGIAEKIDYELFNAAEEQLITKLFCQESNNVVSQSVQQSEIYTFKFLEKNFSTLSNISNVVKSKIHNMIQSTALSQQAINMFESLEKYLLKDRLIDGLQDIQGIRQIDNFRKITNNFSDISLLSDIEILYLNACNWFHSEFIKINNIVQKEHLSVNVNNNNIEIDSFGLFHIFMGDLKPGDLNSAKNGGHLFLPDLKLQTHQVEDFQFLTNDLFSLKIKHAYDKSGESAFKTFFPFGKTPLECTQIVIDAIKYPKSIEVIDSKNPKTLGLKIISQQNHRINIFIESKRAVFYFES